MSEKIMVSLIIEDSNGNSQKLKMRNSDGKLCEEVALPILDYMLSSYKSLDRCFEEGLKNNWISSLDVKVKMVSKEGVEYELPFGKNVETIFRCSESAIFKGGIRYIEKGNQPQMVSAQEFEGFFNEFLFSVLSEEGLILVKNDYFKKYPNFSKILKQYQSLNQNEDDIYARSDANALEKGFSSCRKPKTIEDYLRDYYIFRDSLVFINECNNLKNKKNELIEEKKMVSENKKQLGEKHEGSYYAGKRSLCYIIGNKAAPLILKTDFSDELDDFVVENFDSAKDIRRRYKDSIIDYVKQNKEYVIRIRKLINNEKYNGQLAILEHKEDGTFRRLTDGQYFRFPVIYTSTFKGVKKLYCNINRLREEYAKLKKNESIKEQQIRYKKAEYEFLGLSEKMKEVVDKLEEEKRITVEEKQNVLGQIKKIISDMKDLERTDYLTTRDDFEVYHRVFSKKAVQQIRHVTASNVPETYKMVLDEWAKEMHASTYRYDDIRFILRQLRMKDDFRLEKEENREIDITDLAFESNIIEANKTYIKYPDEEGNEDMYEPKFEGEAHNHK